MKTEESLKDSITNRCNLLVDRKIFILSRDIGKKLENGDGVLLSPFVGGGQPTISRAT